MNKIVSHRGESIAYYDNGEGEVIILLHGYLETAAVWNDFTEGLADYFRVISIDLPGHGSSSVFGETHSMEFMAETVKAVMDEEDIERAMLTGHSMGGYVSLAFLELFPERLNSYCLFHSHPFADTEEAVENRLREKKVVGSGKKDLIYPVNVPKMFATYNIKKFSGNLEHHKKIASDIPDEGIIAVLNGMISRPSRKELMEDGRKPLLLILGRDDNYIPCDEVYKRIKLPLNAELVILEKSGHLGFVEEKEKSQQVIKSFYNKILE